LSFKKWSLWVFFSSSRLDWKILVGKLHQCANWSNSFPTNIFHSKRDE
jgi:hypothetical protein